MTSARSIASNFTIQLLGKGLSVLIGLVSVAILTRVLGTTAFGEYTTATTFLQMFGVVVDFGLTLTMVVMISEKNIDEEAIVGNFFGLRLVSGFLLFSLAPLTILAFPYGTVVQQAVLVGALAYFFMGGATMLVGIFQKYESMWRVAIAETLNRAVLLGLITLFTFISPGVVEMMIASVVANFIWLIVMMRLAKPFVHVKPKFEWNTWKAILQRSWPIAVSIIFNLLYLKGDILFLAYFRDQAEVGLYGVSYRIIDVLTVVPVMFMGLILPSLVNAWSNKDLDTFRHRVQQTFNVFALAVIPIIIGAQTTSTELIELIAGDKYLEAGPVLAILILALIGVFFGALYGHLIVAINKQKVMTWGYIAVAVIAIAGYFAVIPTYGMWGAVAVTLLSEALIAIITFLVVHKHAKTLPSLTTTFKALLAGGVMYLVLTQLNTHVLIDILLGGIIYVVGIFALRAVTIKELTSMLKRR